MGLFIGRIQETNILQDALKTDDSEMIAVIGRRRVGKTFLIQSVYKKHIYFEMTGSQNAPLKEQLQNFTNQLQLYSKSNIEIATPANWTAAFHQLSSFLDTKKFNQKKVLFFDELPWLATHKSQFLSAFGYFWNNWASKKNIVIVICGSAASWMIEKIVNNKGGLHNRITKLISLSPFTLAETKKYLISRKVSLNHYQTIQLYMAMGGIPHYLKEIKPGKSAAQNIDAICFAKNGLLKDEFWNLYPSLFDNATNHISIIRALATKWKGLSRKKIVDISKLPDGGSVTKYLNELNQSGFISSYLPYGKTKKDTLYRLTDEYSLFYLKFIENKHKQSWINLSQLQPWKSWSGYAFENTCLKHSQQIKIALGISGVYSQESSFIYKGSEDSIGFQIDLLIDRQDNSINLCEMKFYESEFTIEKAYAKTLRERIAQFKMQTKTRKNVFLTIISTYGIKSNIHSIGLVDQGIVMDALFK
ncbi:MAG: AAA family ATPase [Bacteroidales bacterium]|nr:AAA family ATPase [Bacteroidales bacterium]